MTADTSKNTNNGNGRMTQAERTALSDQRMFEAAVALINEHGTQKTTLKDIGQMAGYSRGLANYRFGSKEGFLLELFHQFDGRWKKHLDSYVGTRSGIAAILAATDALRDFLQAESAYMRAMYLLWYESLGHQSAMRTSLSEHHQVYRKDARRYIEQGIEAGEIDPDIDAQQFAVQFCAFIFGIVYQWLVDAEALDLKAVFDEYEKNMVKLLQNKESA